LVGEGPERGRFFSWVLTGLVCLGVTFTEAEFVAESKRAFFLTVKSSLCLLFVVFGLFSSSIKSVRVQSFSYAILTACYCTFASFFRGYYFIAIFEMCIIMTFLFPVDWKVYIVEVFLIQGVFWGSILFRFPNVPESHQLLSGADLVSLPTQQLVILPVFYVFLIRSQHYKQLTERRLGLLGRHAARVSHDLKGMIGSPILYLEKLKVDRELGVFSEAEFELSMTLVSNQLAEIHGTLSELARLCSLDELPQSKFKLSEAINSSGMIYAKQLHGIKIELSGDLIFNCDRAALSSILGNLFSNSLQVFRGRKIVSPEIIIRAKSDGFIFLDNGGGFPQKTLASLNSGDFNFNETSGLGMGLKIVTESIKKLNGEVGFSNTDSGVKIDFTLGRRFIG